MVVEKTVENTVPNRVNTEIAAMSMESAARSRFPSLTTVAASIESKNALDRVLVLAVYTKLTAFYKRSY